MNEYDLLIVAIMCSCITFFFAGMFVESLISKRNSDNMKSEIGEEFTRFWQIWDKCKSKKEAGAEKWERMIAGIGGQLKNMQFRILGR